jgi:type IX secretion system PorP/SprF family membrane protein
MQTFFFYFISSVLKANNLYHCPSFFRQHFMLRRYLIGLLLVAIGMGWAKDAIAQDPQFTQFYANPLYLNPAFAGAKRCPRVNMNYRNQWPAISGTFVTYNASFDMHIDALHGGIGGYFMADSRWRGNPKYV